MNTGDATLITLLKQAAQDAGFPLSGAVDLDQVSLDLPVAQYDEWIKAGYSGAMDYLTRGRDRRADPRLLFPEAKSVFCVAWPYSPLPAGASSPLEGPRYARYLRNTDYHREIAERLDEVIQNVALKWGHSLRWKVCVDTSAVLERSWAAWTGLGWIGKNGMLIHPQLGSYLFLAEAFLSEKTHQGPKLLRNYCGNCTRCINHCPTNAIAKPGVVDSRQCISYLTLEKRGELPIATNIREKMGTWIAGCDLCQEICPFNTKASRSPLESQELAIALKDWESLLKESESAYRERVKNSSLSRVKPAQFSRNLALTLANAIQNSDDPQSFFPLRKQISTRLADENDPHAKSEWARTDFVFSQILD